MLENISKTYGDLPLAKYGVCRTAAGKPEKYHTAFVKISLSQIQESFYCWHVLIELVDPK